MRGQRVLDELVGRPIPAVINQKGRSKKLLAKRNELLLSRFYYYGHYKHLLLPEIIKQLETEFFLAPDTIANVVQENAALIQSLRERGLLLYSFRAKWPYLRW